MKTVLWVDFTTRIPTLYANNLINIATFNIPMITLRSVAVSTRNSLLIYDIFIATRALHGIFFPGDIKLPNKFCDIAVGKVNFRWPEESKIINSPLLFRYSRNTCLSPINSVANY